MMEEIIACQAAEEAMPTELAQHFRAELDTIHAALAALPPELADTPWREGGWTRKQIVGHLLDSAANNRQRFVRAAIEGSLCRAGVRAGCMGRRARLCRAALGRLCCAGGRWSTRFLPPWWISIPEERLEASCVVGEDAPVTLRFLDRGLPPPSALASGAARGSGSPA